MNFSRFRQSVRSDFLSGFGYVISLCWSITNLNPVQPIWGIRYEIVNRSWWASSFYLYQFWELSLFPSRSKCTLSAAIFHRLPNVRWKFHFRFCVFGSNFDFWLPIALKHSSSKRLTLPWFLFISLFCIFWTGKRNCVAPLAKQQTPIRPSSDYGQIAPLIFIQTSFQDRISWCFAAFPTYVDEGW